MIPSLDKQTRLLGAILASPRRFLPILTVVGNGCLDPRIRAIIAHLTINDPDDATYTLHNRLTLEDLQKSTSGLTTDQPLSWLIGLCDAARGAHEEGIESLAREIAEDYRARIVAGIFRSSAVQAQENPGSIDQIVTDFRSQVESADLSAPNRYRTAAISDAGLEEADLQRPASIVGNGLITAVEYSVLYGQPGLGKSYLILQLADCVTRGESFFGLPTLQGRVGVISLEVPAFFVRERLRHIRGDRPATGGIVVYPADRLKGLTDLLSPREQAEILATIRGEDLSMICIDPLALAHRGRETQEDLSPVVSFLKELPHRTGCAPLLVHHEPKEQAEKDRSDLDALRGATILRDMAGCLCRLKIARGRLCMAWPKVRHAGRPPDTWLSRSDDSGVLYEIEEPEDLVAKGKVNREKVKRSVVPGVWYRKSELVDAIGLPWMTIIRHLKSLGAETQGSNADHSNEWRLPDEDSRVTGADLDF